MPRNSIKCTILAIKLLKPRDCVLSCPFAFLHISETSTSRTKSTWSKGPDFTNVCTCAENPSTPQINNLLLSVLNVLLKHPRPSCPRKQVSDCESPQAALDDLWVSFGLCSQLDCALPLRLIMAGEDFWAAGVNGTKQNRVANYMFRTIYQILHLHSATTLIVHAKLLLGLSL